MRNYLLGSLIILLLASVRLNAQDGTLDGTFGSGGVLTKSVGYNDNLKTVVIQPDGKIVVGGTANLGAGVPLPNFYINRYDSLGVQDPNFNGGAAKTFSVTSSSDNMIQGLALETDGSILYGGYSGSTYGTPNARAVIGKLNANGTDAINPASFHVNAATYDIVTGMSYNKTTNTIALGSHDYSTSSYMTAFRFKSDLTLDPSFNSNGTVYFNATPSVVYTTCVTNLDDGSMLLGGYSYNASTQVFTVVKLKNDGTADNSFGTNGIAQIIISTPSFTGYVNAMKVLPSGKILLAGRANYNYMGVVQLNADGSVDPNFNTLTYNYPGESYSEAFAIDIQEDNSIIVCGTCTTSVNGLILRMKPDGIIDSTFGSNGVMAIPSTQFYGMAIAPIKSGLGVAYFTGDSPGGGSMVIAKVIYHTQSFNILGKDIASVSSQSDYSIQPVKAGYSYQWTSNNTHVYTRNSNTGDTLTVFFTDDTSAVTLTCKIFDAGGLLKKTVTKRITINPQPTLAQLLADPACSPSQTDCESGYINSFSIVNTKVGSTNTGCSLTGYSDYTASSHYDTLYVGNNYQAAIDYVTATSGIPAYFGVWIDFNNDGKINDSREFVGSSFSKTGSTDVNNMIIPTDADPGPKRMRVRMRLNAPFTANDFCATNGEAAETEDYLVVLNKYTGIKTPNFITPNNDGKNDLFIVHGVDGNANNTLRVFNRVGDLVFEADNYDNTWGGKDTNGNSLKPGTYYYVFSQKVADQKKDDTVKGFLEIRY